MSRDERRILGRWGEYTVRRFRSAHVTMIKQRDHDVKLVGKPDGRHVGITVFKGKELVACIGVRALWNGVGEGWVLTSLLAEECPLLLTKITLRGLNWLNRTKGYHRIGAHVRIEFTQAIAWAKTLGFEIEGYAPGYGPNGEDFIHFGRVCR